MENDSSALFLVLLLTLSIKFLLSSLWKNSLDGRKPRQRLGRIFHRLRFRLLVIFFECYVGFLSLLYYQGVRGWWLEEFPRLIVPDGLRRSAASALIVSKKTRRKVDL